MNHSQSWAFLRRAREPDGPTRMRTVCRGWVSTGPVSGGQETGDGRWYVLLGLV